MSAELVETRKESKVEAIESSLDRLHKSAENFADFLGELHGANPEGEGKKPEAHCRPLIELLDSLPNDLKDLSNRLNKILQDYREALV